MFANSMEELGTCNVVEHGIDTQGEKPFKETLRRLPMEMKKVVAEVENMLKAGIIRESNSERASAIVPVNKKDGSLRLCVDFRRLNLATRKDNYPVPRMDAQTDKFHGTAVFSTIDYASGYYQVLVSEKDRPKTAFVTQEEVRRLHERPHV